jgi:hypothetical protein
LDRLRQKDFEHSEEQLGPFFLAQLGVDAVPDAELVAPHDQGARITTARQLLGCRSAQVNRVLFESLAANPEVGQDREAEAESGARFCMTIASG